MESLATMAWNHWPLSRGILSIRRPRMHFQEMGIPVGSTLIFLDGETDVEVADEHKVKYDGEITPLTAVTRRLLVNDYNIQTKGHWYFNGVLLSEIYDRT